MENHKEKPIIIDNSKICEHCGHKLENHADGLHPSESEKMLCIGCEECRVIYESLLHADDLHQSYDYHD